MNGKDGTKQHFWEGTEEAYYLVKEVVLFVAVFHTWGVSETVENFSESFK
jgi:hypothetical protein